MRIEGVVARTPVEDVFARASVKGVVAIVTEHDDVPEQPVVTLATCQGVVAAYAGGAFGPGYFEGYSEPFNLEKAKKWAQETRCGVLLLRPYWNASLSGQGHVAILLPSGYVLQSFVNISGPDLNWDFTIEESNAGDYYKAMVHPENWSEYEGDEW